MNAHHLSRSYHVRSTTYSMYYVFAHWSSHFIVHAGLCCSCLNRTRRASPFDLACPRVRCNAVQYSVNTYYVVSMFLFRPGTMDTSFFSGGAGKRKKTKKGGGGQLNSVSCSIAWFPGIYHSFYSPCLSPSKTKRWHIYCTNPEGMGGQVGYTRLHGGITAKVP